MTGDSGSPALEDLALIGDMHTAALVTRHGDVVWACMPRFDSPACFAALLGEERHGHWSLRPRDASATPRRAYRDGTLVLETEWTCADGVVRVTEFMPLREQAPDVVRVVEGLHGRVALRSLLRPRCHYGEVTPWLHPTRGGVVAVSGPDALYLRGDVASEQQDGALVADFTVAAGERAALVLTWHPSHEAAPRRVDVSAALAGTESFWRDWSARATYAGPYRTQVGRSLTVLEALIYQPTGGMVAAPTLGLPETLGRARNWDYRYCWLRDATLTLRALLDCGYTEEACAWRDWLLRAASGAPEQLRIMYGPAGERHLPEWEVDWLPGYAGSQPVRVGNAANTQFQLDVYGEVVAALQHAGEHGLPPDPHGAAWTMQRTLVEHVERVWQQPDSGLWESRDSLEQHVHSKVLAWVAVDRAVRATERAGGDAPLRRWRALREDIHAQVCAKGWDDRRGTFTMAYGSRALDAAVLQIPLVGFLPHDDPRVVSTVRVIARELDDDGLVRRYDVDDGQPGREGAFLACSGWLAQCYAGQGRTGAARSRLDRLLATANDLGLLAEEYDTGRGRLVGNFPQAFSHLAVANTATAIAAASARR